MDLIPTVIADACVDDRRVRGRIGGDGGVLGGEEEGEFGSVEEGGGPGGAGLTVNTATLTAMVFPLPYREARAAGVLVAARGKLVGLPQMAGNEDGEVLVPSALGWLWLGEDVTVEGDEVDRASLGRENRGRARVERVMVRGGVVTVEGAGSGGGG